MGPTAAELEHSKGGAGGKEPPGVTICGIPELTIRVRAPVVHFYHMYSFHKWPSRVPYVLAYLVSCNPGNETALEAVNAFAADLAARFSSTVGCTRS